MEITDPTILAIVGGLFALSEILAHIPVVKANSVFQLVYNILATLLGKNKL